LQTGARARPLNLPSMSTVHATQANPTAAAALPSGVAAIQSQIDAYLLGDLQRRLKTSRVRIGLYEKMKVLLEKS
jgi:hypothetical protein